MPQARGFLSALRYLAFLAIVAVPSLIAINQSFPLADLVLPALFGSAF